MACDLPCQVGMHLCEQAARTHTHSLMHVSFTKKSYTILEKEKHCTELVQCITLVRDFVAGAMLTETPHA